MSTIGFHIFLTGGRIATEKELQLGTFVYEDLFSRSGSCEGAICIPKDADSEIELEDELPALVKNLCFAANAELKQSGQGIYYFNSYAGQVLLTSDGKSVTVEGEGIPTSSFDLGEFTTGLRSCGIRFIDLLRSIRCRDNEREKERLALVALLESAL
jgi:hypothetical protein